MKTREKPVDQEHIQNKDNAELASTARNALPELIAEIEWMDGSRQTLLASLINETAKLNHQIDRAEKAEQERDALKTKIEELEKLQESKPINEEPSWDSDAFDRRT